MPIFTKLTGFSMVGCFTSDYELLSGIEINAMSPYTSTGCGASMLANRLSWFYDLQGPSLMVDTACSSSLVALHMACQELRTGNSKLVSIPRPHAAVLLPVVSNGLPLRFERYEGDTNRIPIGGRGRNESHDPAGIVAWINCVAVPQPRRTMSQF